MDCSPLVDDSPCDGLLDALGQAIACPTQPANDERAALPIAAGLASPPPAHAPPLQPAARVFESLCTHMGVPPHPELLASINNLPANAFAPLKPYSHPGQGGAVLKLPADAQPAHVQALLALVMLRPGVADNGGNAPPPDTYLRTVHLDLSGHPMSLEELDDLLLLGPHRLGQCHMLESLVLSRCNLTADAIARLCHWKAMKALESLRRLVLADNPLLGKLTQQQRLGGAPDTASKYVGPEQLFWLETRLFRGAPLQLLDLRHTGFSDAALTYLLHKLATCREYAKEFREAPGPAAPTHDGCRATLECLKLGPPADQPCFSKLAVGGLELVMKSLPRLQVIEVFGLAPEQRPSLQLAWQAVQQALGRHGYLTEGADGSLRLALTDGCTKVAAELLPCEHQPLQPPTPEPSSQQAAEPLLTIELSNFLEAPGKQDESQVALRMPGAALRQPQAAGHAGNVPRSAVAAVLGGGSLDQGARSPGRAAAGAAGRQAPDGSPAARASKQPHRRKGSIAQAAHKSTRMYSGGAAADELPDWGDDVGTDDDATQCCEDGGTMVVGGSEEQDPHFKADYDSDTSEDAAIGFQQEIRRGISKLKKLDLEAGKRASRLKTLWDNVDYPYDRMRWENPSKTRPDGDHELDALLQLKEILEQHGLDYTFPFPEDRRQAVLAWRQRQQEQTEAAIRAASGRHHKDHQTQQQKKKLRKAAELEREAMEDDGTDDDVSSAPARQHQQKRKLVMDDSDDERSASGVQGGSAAGTAAPNLTLAAAALPGLIPEASSRQQQQQRQHGAGHTPAEDEHDPLIIPSTDEDA